jgi:hypothetical protein
MSLPNEFQTVLSKFKMAEIIEKLAGDKDSLRVDIQQVKFTLRNQRFEIDGKVDFNVVHKAPNPHSKPKEER